MMNIENIILSVVIANFILTIYIGIRIILKLYDIEYKLDKKEI
jgi:hypothetical protein